MNDTSDHDLVEQFARDHSEPAFATLVDRYVPLVHSVALRHAQDPQQAQDITQVVFILLARKAGSLGRGAVLPGWLYETARLTAANWRRHETRRLRREQDAYMESAVEEAAPEAVWSELAPLLDDAMSHLSTTDRDAIVLRYFQNKTLPEVGSALGLGESAAHKRVSRALEKLRKLFLKRGVTLAVGVIATAISTQSVQAAPAGFATVITSGSLQTASVGAAVAALVKGNTYMKIWMKLKLAALVGGSVALVCVVASVAISQTGGREVLTTEEIFARVEAKYAALTSYSAEGRSVAVLNGTTLTHTFSVKLARPNLYRIEWQQPIFATVTNTGVVWSMGEGDFVVLGESDVRKEANLEAALSTATGVSGGASETIPASFFHLNRGRQLNGAAGQKRQPDEQVGAVECYVFDKEAKGRTRTIWIGKEDLLIHQVRTLTSAVAMKAIVDRARKEASDVSSKLPKTTMTDSVSTETHANILVNQPMAPSDFAR